MKLPPVLAVDTSKKDEVTLSFALSADMEDFRGHFPDMPILPGVVQIDWVVRFAALHLGIPEPVARDFQVKFRNIIRPDDQVDLVLQLDRLKNRLSFTYKSGDTIMSLGQIKLGSAA